jgi:hypothetical protein
MKLNNTRIATDDCFNRHRLTARTLDNCGQNGRESDNHKLGSVC